MVRAQRGERHAYRPVVSRLCPSAAPLDVVQALLELYPFTHLYIADLDAIQRHGHHRKVIAELRAQFPNLDIWLDAGISTIAEWQAWQALDLQCVVGSESQQDVHQTYRLIEHLGVDRAVLSLDIGAEGQRGPDDLFNNTSCWPTKIVAMTLTRVGSQLGPDWATLDSVQHQGRQVYAAGGVRNAADLATLKSKGVAGALIASALHDGLIDSAELAKLMQKSHH